MKVRKKNKLSDYLKVKKNTHTVYKDYQVKRLKKILIIESNMTFKLSRISNVCKITGNRRAVHPKINLNRHFIRWKLDNNKYLDSWNYD